jgi:hypothetical protein
MHRVRQKMPIRHDQFLARSRQPRVDARISRQKLRVTDFQRLGQSDQRIAFLRRDGFQNSDRNAIEIFIFRRRVSRRQTQQAQHHQDGLRFQGGAIV